MDRRPDPPPLRSNDVLIAAAGTGAWAVALAVLLIIDLPPEDRWWLWVCVAGLLIGLFAVWYVPRLQRSRAEDAERRAARRHQDHPAPPANPAEEDSAEDPAKT